MIRKKTIIGFVFGVISVTAILGGLSFSQFINSSQPDFSKFHGTWLNSPRNIEPFNLESIHESSFNNTSLNNQWTMMFFGFTTCPSICPVTLTELNKMMTILKQRKISPLPHVVFVSLDPKRDNLEKIKGYVTAFNPDFNGARGTTQSVKTLAQEMGVAFTKVAGTDPNHYNIEHSGTVMLFNPSGQLTAFFTMPHDAKKLADDFQLIHKLS